MHLTRLGLRPLLVIAAALAAVLFVVFNVGSSGREDTASAAGTFDPNGVVCINIDSPIFELPATGPIPNAVEILARFEHQKGDTSNTNFELSQVSYVGDTNNNGIPNVPIGNCQTKGTAGEPYTLPPGVPFGNTDPWKRADVKAVVAASPHAISWSTCSYQAGFGGWILTDFNFPLGGAQKDFGPVTPGTNNTWVSPNKCTRDLDSNGTNDPPTFAAAARATQRANENKGTGVVTAAANPGGGLNWDGDAPVCTDWNELDPSKNTRQGLDPFNPGDCGPYTSGNLSGTFDIQDCNPPTGACAATGILYDCISRQSHDTASNYVGSSAVCNDNIGGLSSGDGLPQTDPPGEGHLADGNAAGPPPPPPYTSAAPAEGNGRYCPPGPACGAQPADSLVVTSCFPNVGGTQGPNYVAVVHDGDAIDVDSAGPKADWAALKYDVARVELYTKQSNGECDQKQPSGTPYLIFNIRIMATSPTGQPLCTPTCVTAGFRSGHSPTDWDADGCTDSMELASPAKQSAKCGDDPFNPLDVTGSCASGCNVAGPYSLTATAVRADCQRSGPNCTVMPGVYYSCAVDIQQSGNALSAAASCYIDSSVFTNNKPAAGSATCPPAAVKFCGDGLPGSPVPGCAQAQQVPSVACLALPANPPSRHDCAGLGTSPDPNIPCDVTQWQLLHVDGATILTGTLDKVNNELHLHGCFQDPHGHSSQGAVYIEDATIDIHTGHGFAHIHSNQTNAQCLASSTVDGVSGVFKIDAVRQPPGNKTNGGAAVPCDGASGHPQPIPGSVNKCRNGDTNGTCFDPGAPTTTYCRDGDSDGCFDKDEMQVPVGAQTTVDVAKWGGLRDPINPFDYPDMPIASNKHKIRVDDVTYVVNRFRHDMNLLPVPGTNPYDPKADHTVLAGNNAGETWHLAAPNGQIRVDDVTAVVNSFRHDCN